MTVPRPAYTTKELFTKTRGPISNTSSRKGMAGIFVGACIFIARGHCPKVSGCPPDLNEEYVTARRKDLSFSKVTRMEFLSMQTANQWVGASTARLRNSLGLITVANIEGLLLTGIQDCGGSHVLPSSGNIVGRALRALG
jgi:hypothetical protein